MPKTLMRDTTSRFIDSPVLEDAEWGVQPRHRQSAADQSGAGRSADRPSTIWSRALPGSISDEASLKVASAMLYELGLSDFSSTLDRGYWSKSNLVAMLNEGINFAIGVPLLLKQARERLSKNARGFA